MDHPTINSRLRLLSALEHRLPDRLPVTTHHVMGDFLGKHMGGASCGEFFDQFGLDAIRWVVAHRPDEAGGEFYDPLQGAPGFLEARRIAADGWRVFAEEVPNQPHPTTRYRFVTPKGELSMVLQSNEYTAWVTERLIKEQVRHRSVGAVRHGAEVRCRGGQPARRRPSATAVWCGGTSVASTSLGSRAAGRTRRVWWEPRS